MPRELLDRLVSATVAVFIAGCSGGPPPTAPTQPATSAPATPPASPTAVAVAPGYPMARFAGLGDAPVDESLAGRLQTVLNAASGGKGLTAATISPRGAWSGATGMATTTRAMVPNDQMSIGHITQTIVAAQAMQLVESGTLRLADSAADRLPPDLKFDANGATIADLLGHRSGLPEDFADPAIWERVATDPLHAWTPEDVLATVAPERGLLRGEWRFIGTNYILLGVILEHVTGKPLAEVLRTGVLSGTGYDRLIYQPAERPTAPMAMPSGAAAGTIDKQGGYLPSLAKVTAELTEANMASDAYSLARWWRAFCAGEVVASASLTEMTDFRKRPDYGLGIWDRQTEYGSAGAIGHIGESFGYSAMALCVPEPGTVVVVLANAETVDVGAIAGDLWRTAGS